MKTRARLAQLRLLAVVLDEPGGNAVAIANVHCYVRTDTGAATLVDLLGPFQLT